MVQKKPMFKVFTEEKFAFFILEPFNDYLLLNTKMAGDQLRKKLKFASLVHEIKVKQLA